MGVREKMDIKGEKKNQDAAAEGKQHGRGHWGFPAVRSRDEKGLTFHNTEGGAAVSEMRGNPPTLLLIAIKSGGGYFSASAPENRERERSSKITKEKGITRRVCEMSPWRSTPSSVIERKKKAKAAVAMVAFCALCFFHARVRN